MQYLLGVARYAWACPTFSKITKCQYLQKRLSYFVYLLHVVTHPQKLQHYNAALVRYGPAQPKFSKMTNQYLVKGLTNFVDFSLIVIYILLDIHWSNENMSRMGSQPVRLPDVLNFKKYMRLYELLSWLFACS